MTLERPDPQDDRTTWLSLGTSTVYEAAGAYGAMDPAVRPAWPGARLCGPAYPAVCEPGDNLAIHAAVAIAPPGSVLVIDGGGVMVGYWGEVLTHGALARGLQGVVIDGAVRDIDAIERLGFPVFALGVCMKGTVKRAVVSVGQEAVIAGVGVAPGSLILADRDGVLCLPVGQVDTAMRHALARQQEEAASLVRLAAGETTLDVYRLRELLPDGLGRAGPSVETADNDRR